MKTAMKRLFSLMLVAVLLVSAVPFQADARGPGGGGPGGGQTPPPSGEHEHSFDGDYYTNEEGHWQRCQVGNCEVGSDIESHNFSDATCQAKAKCTVCGYEGGYDSHDFSGAWERGTNGHYKVCQTPGCNETTEPEAHYGGEATCTTGKRCTVCNVVYDVSNLAEHAGGTATCSEQATCGTCGEKYGELDPDNHESDCAHRCDVCDALNGHADGCTKITSNRVNVRVKLFSDSKYDNKIEDAKDIGVEVKASVAEEAVKGGEKAKEKIAKQYFAEYSGSENYTLQSWRWIKNNNGDLVLQCYVTEKVTKPELPEEPDYSRDIEWVLAFNDRRDTLSGTYVLDERDRDVKVGDILTFILKTQGKGLDKEYEFDRARVMPFINPNRRDKDWGNHTERELRDLNKKVEAGESVTIYMNRKHDKHEKHDIWLYIYTNDHTSTPSKRVLLNDYKKMLSDGTVSKSEVLSIVDDYYRATNSKDGIIWRGMYKDYAYKDRNHLSFDKNHKGMGDRVNLDNDRYDHVTIIKARVKGVESRSYHKPDSSNPKTGDMIFMPVMVLGVSASALAVLFFLNKKRAL